MRWISLITIFLLCACNAITGVDDLNFDGTSDTDTDTDIDTDTDTDTCVCTTGDCCDGCEYFPSTTQCSATPENTEYGCTSGDCGADAQIRNQYRYCTGASDACGTGNLQWDIWTTIDSCETSDICEFNISNAWCTNCQYGCTSGSCNVPDCTTGVCCDTSAGTYRPSTYPCDVVSTAFTCQSADCGGDAQEQYTTQYCSGTSEVCNGTTLVGGWIMVEDCTTDAFCEFDTTDSWCTICLYGCSMGECVGCIPTWTVHTVDGSFNGARSVYAADVDGDGDMDVLGAACEANDIAWWENTTGDGTAWTERTVDGTFDSAWTVYAADVDGDGDMDVLGAAYLDDAIAWWENTAGDGTSWTERTVDGAFVGAISVYAADVDGDGDMDVLGAALMDDDIAWWENTAGDGTSWTVHAVDVAFDGARSVYAADVDGDGDMDVLGAAENDDNIAWWENTAGDGTSWTVHAVDVAFDGAYSVYAADVDGDGDMDVLGAAAIADEVTCWENTTGDGTSWTVHAVDVAFDGAYSIYAADVDGDGDMDVLGAAEWDDDIAWWENTAGNGTTWTVHTVDGAFDGARSVYAADVDGDGDMDVLGAAVVADDITWWENDCIP